MEREVRNYYEVLEVPVDATQEEIANAYNRSRNAYSGDSLALYSLMTEEECKQILDTIEEAYSVLSQLDKRREYDRVRGINQKPSPRTTSATNKSMSFASDLKVDSKYDAFFDRKDFKESNFPEKETPAPRSASAKMIEPEKGFNINEKDNYISKVAAQNRFSLHYEVDPAFEREIESTAHFTGELLKKIRVYKKLDIDKMSELTKISKAYINSIENEHFDKLPAAVYTRGFVFQMAKILKLNADVVASSYVSYMKQAKNGK